MKKLLLKTKVTFLIITALLIQNWLYAQSISGNLSLLPNQSIKLEGFNGLKTYLITSSTIDDKGNFNLKYSKDDYGVAYLTSADNKSFVVILNGEDIELKGEAISNIETMKITKGQENKLFEQYAKEHPKREQALSAWLYLEKMYAIDSDPLFSSQQVTKAAIKQEKQRIKDEDVAFLNNLPKDSYVSWFLPAHKLISSVSVVAQYRPDEVEPAIAAFRNMDYTDSRLYKSGLLKDVIESHFWLIENSGRDLDAVFSEMEISIDAMMQYLIKDNKRLNEVTDYLFDFLERRSLFKAAEYLALKALNEKSIAIDIKLAKKLETYRAMKKGNIAPDIVFAEEYSAPGYPSNNAPKKMSDIKSKNTIVVFGASWCSKCTKDISEISKVYENKWKSKGVEVILVSLDEDKESYKTFAKNLPFISTCDFKKWDSKIVKDYYVYDAPTMYLLGDNREILLKPASVKQINAWVDVHRS